MNNIIIYTATGCSHCHEAKDFFKENNLSFIEHNISEDKEAKKTLIKKGVMSVPYIIIDDQEFKGFEIEKIKPLLNI
jgi:glutaredoxin